MRMCALHMHHRIAAAYRAVDFPNDNDDDNGDAFLNSRIFLSRNVKRAQFREMFQKLFSDNFITPTDRIFDKK